MNIKYWLFLLASNFFIFFTGPVISKEFSSTNEVTELIELYTSEGCSSCPPADKWMRRLKSDPMLFKKFIPLSFHVDYWNDLGWNDRFSKRQYTNRQFSHQREGNISQAYTPGFVVNNQEWRNWRFSNIFHWQDNKKNVGILKVDSNQELQKLSISFDSELNISNHELNINIAILGMSLSSEVKYGENGGRKLEHDFVVLSHEQQRVSLTNNQTQQWQVNMPDIPSFGQKQSALVVWLTEPTSLHVIQSTGGYL